MAAKQVLLIVSAVLLQTVYSQYVNSFGSQGLTGVNFDVEAISTAAGALSGYPNYGFVNNGLGLTNIGGLGNVGLIGAGLGNGIGLVGGATGINTGLIGAGLNGGINAGLVGGLNGAALNGVPLVGYPDLLNIVSSGPLSVTTISPIGPSGLAVASDNTIDGILMANGGLPFLSAVAFEGAFPTSGSGIATCGCGNGAVGILSEGFPTTAAVGIGSGFGYY